MSSVIYIDLISYHPFRLGYLNNLLWRTELKFFVFILADLGKSRYISQTSQDDEGPDLGNARIVVTGGRALKSAENFKLIENLAKKLGAAGIIFYFCYYDTYFYSQRFVISVLLDSQYAP